MLVTPDKNIRYQQGLTARTVALVVLGKLNGPYCACTSACRCCRQRGKTAQLRGGRNTATSTIDKGATTRGVNSERHLGR